MDYIYSSRRFDRMAYGIPDSLHSWHILVHLAFITITSQKGLINGAGLLLFHLIIMEGLIATGHFYLFFINVFSQTVPSDSTEFCYYSMLCYWTTAFVANWLAVFLSINRLVAVAKPHLYRYLTTLCARRAMLIGSWILGLTAAAPTVGHHLYRHMATIPGLCIIHYGFAPGDEHLFEVVVTLGCYVPLALTLAVYVSLFAAMKCRTRHESIPPHERSQRKYQGRSTIQRRISMARMLFISSASYCLCFYPIPVIMAFFPYVFHRYPMALLWLRTLVFAGFAAKPALYCALSVEYQQALKRLFRRKGLTTAGDASQSSVQFDS
ncbi:adenosine receptor A2a-like [Paramacrobiotus metropolitanus]|uniref:adenosine receptor A2a-like n=1 Tax=Paramacrobiotus metropolitanus TaxID=2943436 RepID=UPI002445B1F8|nr:adenosine receptor A2a-like [Paramacrobiotus metropolitanus]XP_055351270.1 adenosine receptor A2a-like [Paramacrobiotus metropolitanus]